MAIIMMIINTVTKATTATQLMAEGGLAAWLVAMITALTLLGLRITLMSTAEWLNTAVGSGMYCM